MVVPFAYVQALFANEQYSKAVKVLRKALERVEPDKEGVFYPRGLYGDDQVLFEQIDRLAAGYRLDADLQLLLGYQLLGAGKLDDAVEPLQQAEKDSANAGAAAILLSLLERIKSNNVGTPDQ